MKSAFVGYEWKERKERKKEERKERHQRESKDNRCLAHKEKHRAHTQIPDNKLAQSSVSIHFLPIQKSLSLSHTHARTLTLSL